MGLKSRTKGKAGEREIAAIVRDLTGWQVKRKVRQHDGDSDLEGVEGWSVECKRHATATRGEIAGWWEQAVAQANRELKAPVLFFRRDRDEWRAVWPMQFLATEVTCFESEAAYSDYRFAVETSVEAWAYIAREMANEKEAA